MKKKIIIAGASGFVGKLIVSKLVNNFDVLLLGRSKDKLNKIFPNYESLSYSECNLKDINYDIFIFLSAINSNSSESLQSFIKINRDLCLKFARKVIKNNKYFIYFSSTQALSTSPSTYYSISKNKATIELNKLKSKFVIILNLPIIYGDSFSGKLKFLNFFPKFVSSIFLNLLSSFKPVVKIDRITNYINLLQLSNFNLERNLILTNAQAHNYFYYIFKKITDFSFVLVIMTFFIILFPMIGLMIKLSSKGPIIFSQARIGINGKNFICYKFRTMDVKTPNLATHMNTHLKLNKIGLFLRKLKLDELPQVINIIKGNMSLIGPRPGLDNQTELLNERSKRNVLKMMPGITGLAQVNGIDMSDPEKLAKIDQVYYYQRTIFLDLKIILATIFKFKLNV